jgi:3',5'-cyclic AMP phosphodiesterase CpdA
MAFRIAQISDTHLSAAKPFFVANFRRVGEAVARERVDLVVNTGDISLDGASDDADLAEARRLHDVLALPMRYIPGNHDIGDNVEVPALDHPIDDARRARYLSHFGDDWWTIEAPGWLLLGVNAQLLASGLAAAHEQSRFIADAVARAGQGRIALFIHKPLYDAREDEAIVGGRFLNPAPRRELFAAFGAVRPALVASGHVHQYRAGDACGMSHVWAPSTGFFIPDSRQPRYGLKEVGFVLHELYENGAHASRLMRAPGAEDLSIADFPEAYGPMG